MADDGDVASRARAANVTANAFRIIGQKPLIGRDFLDEDALPGAAPVVILADRFWQSRYGGNRGVVGRSIRINGVPTQMIGVMPSGFEFPGQRDFWMPLVSSAGFEKRDARILTLFGMLRPGIARPIAQAEVTTVARQLESAFPDVNKDLGAQVLTYNEWATDGKTRSTYLMLMGSVVCVVLIACANVITLLLTRAG